jgi:UDP-N-acetylmuramoylalanine--D-glutamate ligase
MIDSPVQVDGARVAVLGLGRSGSAAARLLSRRGASVYASDVASSDRTVAAAEALITEGIEASAAGHDRELLFDCDWIVVSPGIRPDAEILNTPPVCDRPIFSEIEVASWFARAPVAAVTGTNGKTTTTALLGAVAQTGGVSVSVAGNIGRAFSTAVLEDPGVEWYVLEVSSFQLARIETFRPRVAVVLNLTADHLDTYPDVDAYARDKARISLNQGRDDHLCLNAEDEALSGFGSDRGAWVDDGWITLAGEAYSGPIIKTAALKIPGQHNVQNALAATLAAELMGIEPTAIGSGLRSFGGVEHRLERVAIVDGVTFVNDSKATNVESVTVALRAFDQPLIVVLGGRHKGSPYAPLAPLLAARARHVLVIGEAAPRIVSELDEVVDVTDVGTLERAVERARELARPGDLVLLSPACSSYDQFDNYEVRGERFRQLVVAGAEREVAR